MGYNMAKEKDDTKKAINIFKVHGGLMRSSEAFREGIKQSTFYKMAQTSTTITIGRGLYQLSGYIPPDPDLVIVSKAIPKGVICLVSALSFYGITNQIPKKVYVALPKGAEEPRLVFPPVKTFRFSEKTYSPGIQTVRLQKNKIRIYSKEKTIADCFKFRNKIGTDLVVDALKKAIRQKDFDINKLMRFASICRVSKIIHPYLETLL
jgi:predicted transcriptional regulator of viral defense system